MAHALDNFINKVIEENLEAAFPGAERKGNIFRVVHDLHVFKAVNSYKNPGWGLPRSERIAIVNLVIPAGALVHIPRYAAFGSKCRASEAFVHSIFKMNEEEIDVGHSNWTNTFEYRTGATVKPSRTFYARNGVCERGIHFFFSLDQAKRYL